MNATETRPVEEQTAAHAPIVTVLRTAGLIDLRTVETGEATRLNTVLDSEFTNVLHTGRQPRAMSPAIVSLRPRKSRGLVFLMDWLPILLLALSALIGCAWKIGDAVGAVRTPSAMTTTDRSDTPSRR